MLSITVVIPTFRRKKLLEKVLTSLSAQSRKCNRIILVDNDPHQSARQLADNFRSNKTHLLYISNKKGGVTRARNIGLKTSASKITAFLDDDCIPERNWVENINKFFTQYKNKKVILFGRSLNGIPDSVIATVEYYLTQLIFQSDFYFKHTKIYSLGLDTKNFAAYRDQILHDNLLFDNRFEKYTYYEDMDFGIRARQKGYEIIYNIGVMVNHIGRTTFTNFIKRERLKTKAYKVFNGKWPIDQREKKQYYDFVKETHRFPIRSALATQLKKDVLSGKNFFFKLKFNSLLLFTTSLYRFGLYLEK